MIAVMEPLQSGPAPGLWPWVYYRRWSLDSRVKACRSFLFCLVAVILAVRVVDVLGSGAIVEHLYQLCFWFLPSSARARSDGFRVWRGSEATGGLSLRARALCLSPDSLFQVFSGLGLR